MSKGIELSASEAKALFELMDKLQQAVYQAKCMSDVLSDYANADVIDHNIDSMGALLLNLDIGLAGAVQLADDVYRATFRPAEPEVKALGPRAA